MKYRSIERLVRNAAARFQSQMPLDEIPVNLDTYCRALGLEKLETGKEDEAFVTNYEDGTGFLWVGGSCRTRKRFSVCHEIGHVLMERDSSIRQALRQIMKAEGPVQRSTVEEWLCNVVAEELLLPEKRFSENALRLWPCLESAGELSKLYDVSVEVVLRRIVRLGLWRCGLVWMEPLDADWHYGDYRVTASKGWAKERFPRGMVLDGAIGMASVYETGRDSRVQLQWPDSNELFRMEIRRLRTTNAFSVLGLVASG